MKRLHLIIILALVSASSFAQSITSPAKKEEADEFVLAHLYKFDEFTKGNVSFDRDADARDAEGNPLSLQPAQGIVNINLLHQCVIMVDGKDTIPLLLENYVQRVSVGKRLFMKIKGRYYEVLEFGDAILADCEILKSFQAGKTGAYGAVSATAAITNVGTISDFSIHNLTPDLNLKYTWERYPVFIVDDKVALLNEKQLCKMFKKKADAIKAFFAEKAPDMYNMEAAKELYQIIK